MVGNETAPLPALLTIDEVAAMLRQSRRSIYRKIAADELDAVRLGRARSSPLRIRAAALDAHPATRQARATARGRVVPIFRQCIDCLALIQGSGRCPTCEAKKQAAHNASRVVRYHKTKQHRERRERVLRRDNHRCHLVRGRSQRARLRRTAQPRR